MRQTHSMTKNLTNKTNPKSKKWLVVSIESIVKNSGYKIYDGANPNCTPTSCYSWGIKDNRVVRLSLFNSNVDKPGAYNLRILVETD